MSRYDAPQKPPRLDPQATTQKVLFAVTEENIIVVNPHPKPLTAMDKNHIVSVLIAKGYVHVLPKEIPL